MNGFITMAGVVMLAQATGSQTNPGVDLRCGAYCLYISLKAFDRPVGDFETFEEDLGGPSAMGYSMEQLSRAAKSYGVHSMGVETNLRNLEARSGRFACIALLEKDAHFVCIYDIDDRSVFIIDPPEYQEVSRDVFEQLWSGRALLISDRELTLVQADWSRAWFVVPAILVGVGGILAVIAIRRRFGRGSP